VNFALDRNKVVRLAGDEEIARPTCQVLPPNFPGYRAYCPYTLDPGAGRGWTAPDLAKARRLVAASGTSGMSVSLWWPKPFGVRSGEYLEALLESLGYRTSLRLFPDFGTYFPAMGSSHGSWNVAGSGWIADYPAASNFIRLVSCASPSNFGRFCDRKIDAEIRRALRLQERDPVGANESWTALDRELTNQAPWVFLYSGISADFVSKRVGNYQHHPLWGTLFPQLWVR
jgi:peptide/nickel transport system substrate-binding protein